MSDQMQTIPLLAGQRQERESDAAVVACNDYLRMGPGRSLRGLQQTYSETTAGKPPTKNIQTLFDWSGRYDWQARATAYDAEQDQAKTVEIQRLKTEGLAAEYNRIRELDTMFAQMREEFATNGVWHEDIKLSATGKEVRVQVFNKGLIDSMRGILDDIAKEVGGRKTITDLTVNTPYKVYERTEEFDPDAA